ncbi:SRPBCC family protein [Streptomyces sp. NPDC001851]|uniref:SRPBCC family protein n=1 Tax=Streptomyces sp. NPDC001851 TaxID=3154529 RepID=UPI003332C37B
MSRAPLSYGGAVEAGPRRGRAACRRPLHRLPPGAALPAGPAREAAPYGVGAVRSHLWLIGWFRERITRYDPPYATEYVVERSVPPSRHELGRMTFAETDGGTLVRWTTRAEIHLPLLGAPLTRLPARPVITRTFGDILGAAEKALADQAPPLGRRCDPNEGA